MSCSLPGVSIRGEGLMWLIGAVVCLLAAPRVKLSFSAGNGWPHNAVRYHYLMPISCHFGYCKALLFLILTREAALHQVSFTFYDKDLITRILKLHLSAKNLGGHHRNVLQVRQCFG